jgi:hypothetical protein
MNPDDQAMELIRRYVGGVASAEDARQLAELLRADAASRDRFLDTGMRLRSGPWPPRGKVVQDVAPDETGRCYLLYSVWRKEVSVAGPVELGPPHLGGQGGPSAMYGIAVKPLASVLGRFPDI